MPHIEQTETAQDGAVVFVAMELSKTVWLLTTQASPSGKMSSHRLDGGDVADLLALLRRLQAREQQADGEEVQVVVSATRPATTASGCTAASPPRGSPAG